MAYQGICEGCYGTGKILCESCYGKGKVKAPPRPFATMFGQHEVCRECHGRGNLGSCRFCHGNGVIIVPDY